jgi:hypothetical protein
MNSMQMLEWMALGECVRSKLVFPGGKLSKSHQGPRRQVIEGTVHALMNQFSTL